MCKITQVDFSFFLLAKQYLHFTRAYVDSYDIKLYALKFKF